MFVVVKAGPKVTVRTPRRNDPGKPPFLLEASVAGSHSVLWQTKVADMIALGFGISLVFW